jgi:hypothetical protein
MQQPPGQFESRGLRRNLSGPLTISDITKDVMEILHYDEESVSVAMEEIKSRIGQRRCTSPTFKPSHPSPKEAIGDRHFPKLTGIWPKFCAAKGTFVIA